LKKRNASETLKRGGANWNEEFTKVSVPGRDIKWRKGEPIKRVRAKSYLQLGFERKEGLQGARTLARVKKKGPKKRMKEVN